MILFVGRRLLTIVLVSVSIIFFGYFSMQMVENRDNEVEGYQLGETAVAAAQSTVEYVSNAARLDLGYAPTISGDRPITEIVWPVYKNSMGIIAMALVLAVLVGGSLGVMAALTRYRQWEFSLLMLSVLGISAPSFLIAVLLQQGGIKYTVTFGNRLVSMGGYGWDFAHLFMPLVVLSVRPIAYLSRSSFVSLKRIMGEAYIRTAYAKGLSQSRVVTRHALVNFAVPALTALGVSIRFSLSVLPIVEFIFAWPGIGLMILQAITDRVPILVVTGALLIGLTIQIVNLILEVTYRFVDPRVRESS